MADDEQFERAARKGGAMMDIHVTGSIGRPISHTRVESRMRSLLSRLPLHPVTTHITFRDVNGPKGGNDIRCAVLVELPRQPAIRVDRLGPTPQQAFDASYDCVVRQLHRCRERWQDSRRHPKKYYVAKRLLSAAVTEAGHRDRNRRGAALHHRGEALERKQREERAGRQ